MKLEITSAQEHAALTTRAATDPIGFWGELAVRYHWFRPYAQVLTGGFAKADMRWYDGGTTNLAYNCLDRHLAERASHTALVWEPNEPTQPVRRYSFADLHAEVCRVANALLSLGITRGDRVAIYLPMVPEAAMAMLACARIGAVHSVVFGGFSAQSLADRINDSGCRLLITADSGMRGTKEIRLKDIADEAVKSTPSIERVLVLRHTGSVVAWDSARDLWWHELVPKQKPAHTAAEMDAEAPLFVLYTSGSTGKPKGIVHTTGGYMVYVGYTFRNVFQVRAGDVFWCTADVGWITGHSYLLYGALLNGTTTVMFEGVPNHPDFGRFWEVIDRHRVNIFYTAPTAIRSLMAAGDGWVDGKDLSSLRVLGTVGEPINEEAWHWYHSRVGRSACPIVDTWWQTETGGILISNIAGVTPDIPAHATLPIPGIRPLLVNEKGEEITTPEAEGNLCIGAPWPGIARTTWGDHERFKNTYFTTYPGLYFTGDGAKRDADGNYRITGRVDDVINVSGHRIGTAEVEDALNEHPSIVESAVVGYPHDIKGQGIWAFVILESDTSEHAPLRQEVGELVTKLIGPFARPDKLTVVQGLPKTRSGKIMRRILRKIAEGETNVANLGDTSTLLDPSVVEAIAAAASKP
jgi:acetyl-CoA synthetase